MREAEWVELIACEIRSAFGDRHGRLEVRTGLRLAYGHEIASYGDQPDTHRNDFETDMAVVEVTDDGRWKPRVVVEAKIGTVTTHDAITYSRKAAVHRSVHPYLRYGIALGDRKHYPLPGRLYRHGEQFDFMISFCAFEPSAVELSELIRLLVLELEASRALEKILYESRSPHRDRYTVLHRRLELR